MKITITKEEVLKALKLPADCEIKIVEAGKRDGYYDVGWLYISEKQPENFTGMRLIYYKNGQLSDRIDYINGKLNGLRKKWFENGNLWYSENYKDGELHGAALQFYESGALWIETNYKHGRPHGTSTHYHESGQINTEENYEMGLPV